MPDPETTPTAVCFAAFVATVSPPARQADAERLDALFRLVTGWSPVMWGPTMVGYGAYAYRYASGHGGRSLATGFSPRKAELSLYLMAGFAAHGEILARLGPHRVTKACLYIKRLDDNDMDVLAELIRAGLDDLGRLWTVEPS